MEQLVWQAWRDLREADAVFRALPTVPPLETLIDVTTAARLALLFDRADWEDPDQLSLFWD